MACDEILADRILNYFIIKKRAVTEKKMMGGVCYLMNDKLLKGTDNNKVAGEWLQMCVDFNPPAKQARRRKVNIS